MHNKLWRDCTFIGFDTETTGKYPLADEVCEVAAVKWRNGKVIDEFQSLIHPKHPMGDEVIAIHGITNAMVEGAPSKSDVLKKFHAFIQEGILIAHHAPFDLGFLAPGFEELQLDLPPSPVICSSLLSRKIILDSANHRLQTLIGHLQLPQGQAHRALDDAKACLGVALNCMERLGEVSLEEVLQRQGGAIYWQRFSIRELQQQESAQTLIQAILAQQTVEITYAAGSHPGKARRVRPVGLVRSLDGDFLVAFCETDKKSKRYFFDKITSVS